MPQTQIDIKTTFTPDLLKTLAGYTRAVEGFYQKLAGGPAGFLQNAASLTDRMGRLGQVAGVWLQLVDQLRGGADIGNGVPAQVARDAEAFNVAMVKAERGLQDIFIHLAGQILPTMTELVNYARAWGTLFVESWKNGRLDELIGLTIQAGFEQARKGVAILWDAFKELFTSDNFKLLGAVVAMEITKGLAHAVIDFVELLGAAADYFCDEVAVGLLNAAVAMQNHLANWFNNIPLFTKTFGRMGLAEKSAHEPSFQESYKTMQSGGQVLKDWVDNFFNDGIAAARELWGKAGEGLDAGTGSATQKLKALLDKILRKEKDTETSTVVQPVAKTASAPADGQAKNEVVANQNKPTEYPLTWEGQFTKVIGDLQTKWGAWSKQVANTFSSVFEKAVSSISSGIAGLIEGTKTWGQALRQISSTILNTVINAFVEMGVRYVSTKLLMSATDSLIAKKTQAENATTLVSAVPTGMAQAGAQGGWYGLAAYIALFIGGLAALTALTSNAREFGGPVTAGMPYIVGEKRPELFIPGQSGIVLPSVPVGMDLPPARRSLGEGGSSTNIHFAGVMDSEALAIKGLSGKRGRKFLLDFQKGSVREVTGRG